MKFTTGHDVDGDGEKDIYLHHNVSDQEIGELATDMGRTVGCIGVLALTILVPILLLSMAALLWETTGITGIVVAVIAAVCLGALFNHFCTGSTYVPDLSDTVKVGFFFWSVAASLGLFGYWLYIDPGHDLSLIWKIPVYLVVAPVGGFLIGGPLCILMIPVTWPVLLVYGRLRRF